MTFGPRSRTIRASTQPTYAVNFWLDRSLPTTLSKMMHLGMKFEDVLSRSTAAPGRIVNRVDGLGTLTVGGPAFLDQSQIKTRKYGMKGTWTAPAYAGITPTLGLDLSHDDSEQNLARTGRTWVPPTVFREFAPFVTAIVLAAVNMVGGFLVTDRMLQMFTRKKKPAAAPRAT